MFRYIIIILVLLGFLLRSSTIFGSLPGFTPDEAAFGFNAKSLLLTGKDEFSIPLLNIFFENLKSFGDYKLPLYSVFSVLPIAVFGLSEWSTRLSNMVMGSFAGICAFASIYLIAKNKYSALFGLSLISLSPWLVPLSLGAFEASLPITLIFIALAYSKKNNPIITSIFLSLSFYSYHSSRIMTPLLVAICLFLINKSKRATLLILVFILCIPGLLSLFGSGSQRINDIAIWNSSSNLEKMANSRLKAINSGHSETIARLIYNKYSQSIKDIFPTLFSYLSPEFLIFKGARETTYGMVPGIGLIPLASYILFIYGSAIAIKNKNSAFLLLILLTVAISVLSSLSGGPGSAGNRSAIMIIPITIIASAALLHLKRYYRILIALIIINNVFLLAVYFKNINYIQDGMLYGRKQAIEKLIENTTSQDNLRISRSLSEPHIYYAFYSNLNPIIYQEESKKWPDWIEMGYKFLDQLDEYKINNVSFGNINTQNPNIKYSKILAKPEELSTFKDGDNYFSIYNKKGIEVLRIHTQ